jgi:hypothetical protein
LSLKHTQSLGAVIHFGYNPDDGKATSLFLEASTIKLMLKSFNPRLTING